MRLAELIGQLEGDRGFYAGTVGWCDQRGDGRWVVSIRCAQLSADLRRILPVPSAQLGLDSIYLFSVRRNFGGHERGHERNHHYPAVRRHALEDRVGHVSLVIHDCHSARM